VKLVLEALTRVEGLSAENQVVKVGDWSGYDELARDEFDGQAQLIPTGKLVRAKRPRLRALRLRTVAHVFDVPSHSHLLLLPPLPLQIVLFWLLGLCS